MPGNEGVVHQGIAPGVEIFPQELIVFRNRHNNPINRLGACIDLIVDLVQGVCPLGATGIGRPRPGPGVQTVPRFQVKFHDRPVRVGRQHCTPGITHIVVHGQGNKRSRAQRGHPVEQVGRQAVAKLVLQLGTYRNFVTRRRNGRIVPDVQDHRGNICRIRGIGSTRCRHSNRPGLPILALLIGKFGIHQFKRSTTTIVLGQPDPPVMPPAVGSPATQGPIPFIAVTQVIRLVTKVVLQADALPLVAQSPNPGPAQVRHRPVRRDKLVGICRNHDKAPGRNRYVAKGKGDAGGECPAQQLDGTLPDIDQFNVLLGIVFTRGVVHDFIDHHRPGREFYLKVNCHRF